MFTGFAALPSACVNIFLSAPAQRQVNKPLDISFVLWILKHHAAVLPCIKVVQVYRLLCGFFVYRRISPRFCNAAQPNVPTA